MRIASDAQLAFINGGGIRTGLPATGVFPSNVALRRPDMGYAPGPPFDLIVDDVRAMLPFGNRIAKVQVTGAQLFALLEHALAQYNGNQGRGEFPQISGFSITFDPGAPAGARVQTVTLNGGTSVDNDEGESYALAISDFVWYGGTGFLDLVQAAAIPPELLQTIDAAVIEHLIEISLTQGIDLLPTIEGRIQSL